MPFKGKRYFRKVNAYEDGNLYYIKQQDDKPS